METLLSTMRLVVFPVVRRFDDVIPFLTDWNIHRPKNQASHRRLLVE